MCLAYWRLPQTMPDDALAARKMFDAVEFARLASNRWRYYHQDGDAVTSMKDLMQVILRHSRKESAMILITQPTWPSRIPVLGIAYVRRTWCHHLFLEFLATHPHVIAKRREKIGGVGVGLLLQLVSLAETLNIPCIWGEATEFSAKWYEEQLGVETVLDHFFIEDEVMKHCCNELHKTQEQMLARRAQT